MFVTRLSSFLLHYALIICTAFLNICALYCFYVCFVLVNKTLVNKTGKYFPKPNVPVNKTSSKNHII